MIRQITVSLVTAILLAIPVLTSAIPLKGKSLPTFVATDVAGWKVSSAAFVGKVVLLAISADNCTYCKTAIPRLNSLYDRYGSKGLQVQGLFRDSGFGLKKLNQYIESNQVTYPLALATSKTLSDTIGAYSVPTYILLDRKGNVAGYYRGYSEQNMQEIEKQVKLLVAE
jgi:peroxiredoxin